MNIWTGIALIVALTAARAPRVTGRLSFMRSGAQLGITVTALLAGCVAEPFLGQGLAALLGRAGVPHAVSLSIAVALALAVATVIQVVLGELAPKNLALTKPEFLAKALSRGRREHRAQLALVTSGGAAIGLVALEDPLERVIGECYDETDTFDVEKGKPG